VPRRQEGRPHSAEPHRGRLTRRRCAQRSPRPTDSARPRSADSLRPAQQTVQDPAQLTVQDPAQLTVRARAPPLVQEARAQAARAEDAARVVQRCYRTHVSRTLLRRLREVRRREILLGTGPATTEILLRFHLFCVCGSDYMHMMYVCI
jgi:hypothetical protein